MALEVFVEREIEPGKYLAIIGTGEHRDPGYVIGLQYAVDGRVRFVKLLPPHSPRILSARQAIDYYHCIHSETEFVEECERAGKLH